MLNELIFFFFFFVVRSDRDSGASNVVCCQMETLHRAEDLLLNWCVSRPDFCSQVLMKWAVLQEVFHRHIYSSTVACRGLTNMEFGVHMLSEPAVFCFWRIMMP